LIGMKRGQNRRRLARLGIAILLLTLPWWPARSAFAGDEPLSIALLPSVDPELTYAEGWLSLLERSFDRADLSFKPVSLPDHSRATIASLFGKDAGRSDAATRSYLSSEIRAFEIDAIALLEQHETSGAIHIALHVSAHPFDDRATYRASTAAAESLGVVLGTLADSAASHLGGEPAGTRIFHPVRLGAEDAFGKGIRFGSLALLQRAIELDKNHDEARSALGFRLFLRGSRIKGRRLLDEARAERLDPLSRMVHRARIAYAAGDEGELHDALDSLSLRFEGRFETELLHGLESAHRRDRDEARKRYIGAIRRHPLDPFPHLLLGESALRNGHLDLARDEYRRALALAPGDHVARIGLASVFFTEGLLHEASDALDPLPPPDPHGMEGIKPLLLHLAARAGFHWGLGRFNDARHELIRARQQAYLLDDEEGLIDISVRLFHLGLSAAPNDWVWPELSEIRARTGADPELLPPGYVAYLEGLYGARQGDFGTTMAKRLEIESTPGADPIWTDLIEGYYLIARGDGWEALLPLRRNERIRESSLGHHLMGQASLLSGRESAATRELEWVVERGESLLDLPVLIPLSFYYLGRALEEQSDAAGARLAYTEFLHYWQSAESDRPELIHAQTYLGLRESMGVRKVHTYGESR